jgi:hypothetical protein
MKKSFKVVLILGIFIFISNGTKAQLDTAWIQNLYQDQYIFPPIIDTNYTSTNTSFSTEPSVQVLALETYYPNNNSNTARFLTGFSQRYEVDDSVKIMGTSLLVDVLGSSGNNVVSISIWDTTMTTMLYSKGFFLAGYSSGYQLPATTIYPYIEFIFDTTLTLYEDYNVAVEFLNRCKGSLGPAAPLFMTLSDYTNPSMDLLSDFCTPYGICTKYRPYVKFECSDNLDWIHVDSVTNWLNFYYSYHCLARYQASLVISNVPNLPTCDSVVYKAIGLCPIRALEDTLSDGNDTILNGGDTLSNGNDTILNGGDSTNNALQLSKQLDESVKLSPIPADEVLNISSDYNILSIEVFDAMNRFIERKELNATTLQLNIGKYQSGTYFIRIKTDKGLVKKKFIVS